MTPEYFDRIFKKRGQQGLKNAFCQLLRRGGDELCSAIADERNSFPVMYLLAGEIEHHGLESCLNGHVVYAYWLTCCKAGDDARCEKYASWLPCGDDGTPEPNCTALKWMIATGADWDGPSSGRDSFDAAIDLAAAYMSIYCPEPELMKKIVELIFRRNRQHFLVHDLVWGFFQAANAEALSAVAAYITSENQADSNLACELLGLESKKTRAERHEAHRSFTEWLSENRPYIYLTGESLNAATSPRHLALDAGAKHLKKEIHPRTRETLSPLTDEERRVLAVFRAGQDGGEPI